MKFTLSTIALAALSASANAAAVAVVTGGPTIDVTYIADGFTVAIGNFDKTKYDSVGAKFMTDYFLMTSTTILAGTGTTISATSLGTPVQTGTTDIYTASFVRKLATGTDAVATVIACGAAYAFATNWSTTGLATPLTGTLHVYISNDCKVISTAATAAATATLKTDDKTVGGAWGLAASSIVMASTVAASLYM
jgi:hypothetical protein